MASVADDVGAAAPREKASSSGPRRSLGKPLRTVLSETVLCDLAEDQKETNDVFRKVSSASGARPRVQSEQSTTSSQPSVTNTMDSGWRFAEPAQTLIFLDWDDTLFPTTELFSAWRQGLSDHDESWSSTDELPQDLANELDKWREAVWKFLCTARGRGDRVAVVTNSKRPWVHACISRFAPNLRQLFDEPNSRLHIVYADEVCADFEFEDGPERRELPCCLEGCRSLLRQWIESLEDEEQTLRKVDRRLTRAKHAAMKREATGFYSRYAGQTWKNILCMGDAVFEHNAVRELAVGRKCVSPERERLRTKTILTPRSPSVEELALHLEFSCLLLNSYVAWDGNFDINLTRGDPLVAISLALRMPQLRSVPVPRATWGLAEDMGDEEVAADEWMTQLTIAVQEGMANLPILPVTSFGPTGGRHSF